MTSLPRRSTMPAQAAATALNSGPTTIAPTTSTAESVTTAMAASATASTRKVARSQETGRAREPSNRRVAVPTDSHAALPRALGRGAPATSRPPAHERARAWANGRARQRLRGQQHGTPLAHRAFYSQVVEDAARTGPARSTSHLPTRSSWCRGSHRLHQCTTLRRALVPEQRLPATCAVRVGRRGVPPQHPRRTAASIGLERGWRAHGATTSARSRCTTAGARHAAGAEVSRRGGRPGRRGPCDRGR